MEKQNFNTYSFFTYALFFVIVKPYFLPDLLRQGLKVAVLAAVFLFLLQEIPARKLWNISLIFAISVLISGTGALIGGDYGWLDFIESALYALTFYDLYTFIRLCGWRKQYDRLLGSLYRINLLYCILTILSVAMSGVENNSNDAAYFFGNKFIAAYLFISLAALYGATKDMRMRKHRIILGVILLFSIGFTKYIDCSTAMVALIILFFLQFLSSRWKIRMARGWVVVGGLSVSALSVIWMEKILNIDWINRFVFEYLDKSYTVYGRLEIYGVYLKDIIMDKLWIGYGYSNTYIKDLTGVYSNAQNGLLEITVNFGLIGTAALLFTVIGCYRNSQKNLRTFYLSLVVIGMVIASFFEISLNWFFFLGIFLINANRETEVTGDVSEPIRTGAGRISGRRSVSPERYRKERKRA